MEMSHGYYLEKATVLSGFQVKRPIPPLKVIAVLNDQGIPFVLVGSYGLAGWMKEPRATSDVDVLVAARQHKKAIAALLASFPSLGVYEEPAVTRLRDRRSGDLAIDLMKPSALYRILFKKGYTEWVRSRRQEFRIPSLEMALAMKFASIVGRDGADPEKYQDAHDFILMVKVNAGIDLQELGALGELVYTGGGANVVELVRKVRAAEKLIF